MHIVLLTAVLLAGLAKAGGGADTHAVLDCKSDDEPRIIKGCTAVIEDRSVPTGARLTAHFRRGVAYEYQKDYQKALADFDAVIRLAPVGAAFANRGHIYQQLGDDARALAELDEAIKRDPKFLLAYQWRGELHYTAQPLRAGARRLRHGGRHQSKIRRHLLGPRPGAHCPATTRKPRSPTTAC